MSTPDKLIPACAAEQRGAASRWANLACLCVPACAGTADRPARRQEDIGYGS